MKGEARATPGPFRMGKDLAALLRDYERMIVERTLNANGRNRRKTALALGLSLRGLEKLLARHGLARVRYARRLPFRIRQDGGVE